MVTGVIVSLIPCARETRSTSPLDDRTHSWLSFAEPVMSEEGKRPSIVSLPGTICRPPMKPTRTAPTDSLVSEMFAPMIQRPFLTCVLLSVTALSEAPSDELPTIRDFLAGRTLDDGFLPMARDADEGKVYLRIDRFDEPLLWHAVLTGGLGSNPVGLDRSLTSDGRLVTFHRVGRKVLLFEDNLRYRASSDDPSERRAVDDSFARSVLHAFPIVAADGTSVLVDATAFALRDAMNVTERLKRSKQGKFERNEDRSALALEHCKTFPRNTNVEAWLTFTTAEPGSEVRATTPDPHAVTLRVRQAFVHLPEEGFTPRRHDPRIGMFGPSFHDYAKPIDQPLETRLVARHRLRKMDPGSAPSDVVEPIVYYLDRGTPEPIRTALLDGANWWAEAFEAAGFRNAFRVELLPEDADPADIRYNTIQWVHRATRGWSFGHTILDPRTGEILKGHVVLGSLRVRQDFLLAQGLLGAEAQDGGGMGFALARLRQLAAHEVGHTLGLVHNFAASSQDRASVMDYPAPLVRVLANGAIDVTRAYAEGLGPWDVLTIRYGYSEFDEGDDEDIQLGRIVRYFLQDGIRYVTDDDARPAGSAHPHAHLWDNETSPIQDLENALNVRRAALHRFDGRALANGRPWAELEEILVPLVLHHRYALEAATKWIGGVEYAYAVKGDGQMTWRTLPAHEQRAALQAVLQALDPEELALDETVLALIPPRPPGFDRHAELFPTRTAPMMDPIAIAEVQATLAYQLLLHPARANRLQIQSVIDSEALSFRELLERLVERAFREPRSNTPYHHAIARASQRVLIAHLVQLLGDAHASAQVRAHCEQMLYGLLERIEKGTETGDAFVHEAFLHREITRYLERRTTPFSLDPPKLPELPPGSPIGMDPCCSFRMPHAR